MLTYKAMYKFLDQGVHAEALDFPGTITVGENLEEARRLLASALKEGLARHIVKILRNPADGGSGAESLRAVLSNPQLRNRLRRFEHARMTFLHPKGQLMFAWLADYRGASTHPRRLG